MTDRRPAPHKKDDLIAELVASCQLYPGTGCRRRGRPKADEYQPWCVACRAAETIRCQVKNLNGFCASVQRLNKRCQMVEAAAGAKAYSDEGKRIAKYLHERIRELRAEVLTYRRDKFHVERLQRQFEEDCQARLAEKDRRQAGYTGVYFVQSGDFIKIGISSDVRARVKGLNSTHGPTAIQPLAFIPRPDFTAAYQLEGELHVKFGADHHRGEWFRDNPSLREFIAEHAQPWPGADQT